MPTKNLVLAHKLIGKIPQDWEYIEFSELYSQPIRDFGSFSSTKLITFLNEGIPFIKSEMIKEGAIDWSNTYYISKEVHKALNKSYVKRHTILFSKIGSALGKAVVYEGEHGECNSNAAVAKIVLDNEKADKYFYTYLLNNPIAKRQFIRLIVSLLPRINLGDINSLIFPYPPLPEQKKIAQILSTWDKAITTTEQLLTNSQQQKKALMQQLLTGKKRLLDENGVRFSGEWKTVHLADICTVNPKKATEPEGSQVSFIGMDSVSEGARLIYTATKHYNEVSKGFTSFKNNDVLVAKITPCFENGKGAYVYGLVNGIGFGSTEFHVLRATERSNSKYLYYLTNTAEFRIRGEANMQGSAGQKRVSTDYLKTFKVKIPPSVKEQAKVADLLWQADKELSILEVKLEKLKQEKKALMQQLLTGKRRVKIEG